MASSSPKKPWLRASAWIVLFLMTATAHSSPVLRSKPDLEEPDKELSEPQTAAEVIRSDTLDDLELCTTFDHVLLTDLDTGSPISSIPVSPVLFRAGLFVQPRRVVDPVAYARDCTAETCVPMQNTSQVGALYCELCVFASSSASQQPKGVTDRVASLKAKLERCDPEVTRLARSCRHGPCIQNAPTPEDLQQQVHVQEDDSGKFEAEPLDNDEDQDPERRALLLSDLFQWDFPKNRWMGELASRGLLSSYYDIRMNDILFPGSHDSTSINLSRDRCTGLPGLTADLRRKAAKTQEVNIYRQMNEYGMRFLDLRVHRAGNVFWLHHGYFVEDGSIHLTLTSVLNDVNTFLNNNPTETVVVAIRTSPCASLTESAKNIIRQMLATKYARLREMRVSDLTNFMANLKGIGLVDIQENLVEERFPGAGVMRPHEWANYHKKSSGSTDKFNLWGFFPGVDLSNIVSEFAWCLTIIGCFTQDGLEDWDKNFERHMWQMHSVIGQSRSGFGTKVVNALFGNRVNKGSLYDVALRITLYRIYKKRGLPYDVVIPIDYVNDWDKKFEYHCPKGAILQGFQSYHSNYREDRRWKAQCRFVDFIFGTQYRSDSTSTWPYCGVYNCHHPMMASGGSNPIEVKNGWDMRLHFYFADGRSALTGFGGVHDNHKEDRRWWFYVAKIKDKTSISCSWTGYVNSWDKAMNWYTLWNQWIAGVDSYHSNYREDRRWRFYVCSGT